MLGFAYRQYVTQIVVGEPRRSRWKELLRGIVRQPADPAGREHRHPRHRAARAVIPRGPGRARSVSPSRRSPREQHPVTRVDDLESPRRSSRPRNASSTTRRSRASSSARSTGARCAGVSGQPTAITTTRHRPGDVARRSSRGGSVTWRAHDERRCAAGSVVTLDGATSCEREVELEHVHARLAEEPEGLARGVRRRSALSTCSSGSPRTAAIRGAWNRRPPTEMSGSRPLPRRSGGRPGSRRR